MSKNFFARFRKKKQATATTSFEVLNTEEKKMIQGIVDLSASIVREIMVPRTETVFLDVGWPLEKYLSIVIESGYSRFPVYKDKLDNIIGILHVKDLLRSLWFNKDKQTEIGSIIKPAYFVPESKKLNSLLKEFKKRKVHIAVVVDEYGGTSGIVCLEDILEQIVGEIQDEFDYEPDSVLKIGEGDLFV